MKRQVLAVAAGVLFFGIAPSVGFASTDRSVAIPANGTIVPFVAGGSPPLVHVRINGTGYGTFMIDTGSRDVVLDPAFARAAGLAKLRKGRLDSLALGEAVVHDVPFTLGIPNRHGLVSDESIEGVIGTSILLKFLTSIDYVNQRLELRPLSESSLFERNAAEERAVIVPMWISTDGRIFVRSKANGSQEKLLKVDTLSPISFPIPGLGAGPFIATIDPVAMKVFVDTPKHFIG